ncbi:hypothetical protein HGRIS_004354 [Hohenbuehelia grisea]|uniref:Chromo domain-containing protein n=1 Tax=Hohenbuehelia grisea TaxID=104357 RepID=A0ABR3JCS4_9AGAR
MYVPYNSDQYIFPPGPFTGQDQDEGHLASEPRSPTLSEQEVQIFGHRIADPHPLDGVPDDIIDPRLVEEMAAAAAAERHLQERRQRTRECGAAIVAAARAAAAAAEEEEEEEEVLGLEAKEVMENEPESEPGFLDAPPSPTPTKKRARALAVKPSLAVDDISLLPNSAPAYEIIVCVPEPVVQRSKGSKNRKADPKVHKFGPFETTASSLKMLLQEVADAASTRPRFLRLTSIEWRWLKPQNSEWMPLHDEKAFMSLFKQIQIKNKSKNAQISGHRVSHLVQNGAWVDLRVRVSYHMKESKRQQSDASTSEVESWLH